MSDEGFGDLAAELDSLAERLADRALALLRRAVDEPDHRSAGTERLVTRARRSLEKAAALLREADASG